MSSIGRSESIEEIDGVVGRHHRTATMFGREPDQSVFGSVSSKTLSPSS
jgi:hypothetical protein